MQEKNEEEIELEQPEETGLEALSDKQILIVNNIDSSPKDFLKTIALYGDVTEDKSFEIVSAFYAVRELLMQQSMVEAYEKGEEEPSRPKIEFIISTYGGSLAEMFAMVDCMKDVSSECDIETKALGKVMSAGVPLLAAGTKGMRKIGRNCRVMIHGVTAAYHGNVLNLENEMEEIKWLQDRYINCLSENTKLTPSKIKKMLKNQLDVYLSAEEAVNCGIADIII